MTEKQAMMERHSVRSYLDKPIEQEKIDILNKCIEECNAESGLNIQLVTNEKKAFSSLLARYGKFIGVANYFALVGNKNIDDQVYGYYGERLVLKAQALGLNTCWVALTFKKIKKAFTVKKGEKLKLVISLGYGKTQGVQHKSKPLNDVCEFDGKTPAWFLEGVNCALNAPTAVNQQKFFFTEKDGVVTAKHGVGFYARLDLGIAKYHFELGAGKENFKWSDK